MNHLDWERPLRSASPTVSLALRGSTRCSCLAEQVKSRHRRRQGPVKGIKWDLGVLSPAGVLRSGHTALLRGICPGVEALSLPGKLAGRHRLLLLKLLFIYFFAFRSCVSSSTAPAATFRGSYLVGCEQTARREHIIKASHTAAGIWIMGTGWSPGNRGVAHRAPRVSTPDTIEGQSHPQKALHIQRDSPTLVFSLPLTNHTA